MTDSEEIEETELTPEEARLIEKKFNEILALFDMPGWKHFIEDTQETLKQLRDSVNELPDDQIVSGVKYNRGFAACMAYEQVVRNNYDNFLEDQRGEANDAPL